MTAIKQKRLTMVVFLFICLGFSATAAFGQEGDKTAMPDPTPASIAMSTPTPVMPVITSLKGVTVGMSKDEVKDLLGKPKSSDKTSMLYSFSKTETAQIGLDTKSKVRTIALLFMDGDPKAMSFADVFGPDAKAYPKKNGSIYKMVRYPAAGYWVSYSLTNPTKNAMTVVTMRKMVKR